MLLDFANNRAQAPLSLTLLSYGLCSRSPSVFCGFAFSMKGRLTVTFRYLLYKLHTFALVAVLRVYLFRGPRVQSFAYSYARFAPFSPPFLGQFVRRVWGTHFVGSLVIASTCVCNHASSSFSSWVFSCRSQIVKLFGALTFTRVTYCYGCSSTVEENGHHINTTCKCTKMRLEMSYQEARYFTKKPICLTCDFPSSHTYYYTVYGHLFVKYDLL